MRKLLASAGTVAICFLIAGLGASPMPASAEPAAVAAAPAENATVAANERAVEEILKRIAGREKEPAEKVFRNIQVMKGTTAERLLRAMAFGYSRSLGVGCEHCHVTDDWAADEKRPKKAAREMILFTRQLNERLKEMQNLDTMEPVVNCATCHRGQLEPETSLDSVK